MCGNGRPWPEVDVDAAVRTIDDALRAAADPARAEKERAYLKSELVHYGASVPSIRRVATSFLTGHPELERPELIALVDRLWAREVHELRMAAVELLAERTNLLAPGDVSRLETWVRDARTWALVDPLAVQVAGHLVETHPELEPVLRRWAHDDDVWLRRTVLLVHLAPMRRGDRDVFARFTSYAEGMLEEREFFIRKAIGWVLRERAKRRPDEVFSWLLPRRGRAAGLTLREASKYLSEDQRAQLSAGRDRRR